MPPVSHGCPAVLPRNMGHRACHSHPVGRHPVLRSDAGLPQFVRGREGPGRRLSPGRLEGQGDHAVVSGTGPQPCPTIFNPVAGLEGEFGPLAAGDWVFTCPSRDTAFEVLFTVRNRFAHYVDVDARGSVPNGRSWETALLTLQDALAVAGSGDEFSLRTACTGRTKANRYRPATARPHSTCPQA